MRHSLPDLLGSPSSRGLEVCLLTRVDPASGDGSVHIFAIVVGRAPVGAEVVGRDARDLAAASSSGDSFGRRSKLWR